jgi:cardiolipin synthase
MKDDDVRDLAGGLMRSVEHSDTEALFFSNVSFFLRLAHLIKKSKKTINISVYIFDYDRLGKFIISLLDLACKRGVRVQIIVDGYGSLGSYLNIYNKLDHSLAEVRIYNPLPWPFSHFYLKDYLKNNYRFPFITKVNRRNHTKIINIDSKKIFLGSRNLTRQTLKYRETSVLIKNLKTVKEVELFFEWLWDKSFYFKKPLFKKIELLRKQDTEVYFSHPRKARKFLLNTLIEKINQSQKHIQIIMPYFFPPLKLVKALCRASLKGVSVEFLLPSKTDIFVFPLMNRLFYKVLIKSKVGIFEYQEKMLHAKQVRIDDWALVGSSNLNSRSFFHDIEIDYALKSPESIESIIRQFDIDKRFSKQINTENYPETIGNKCLMYFISKLFGNSI